MNNNQYLMWVFAMVTMVLLTIAVIASGQRLDECRTSYTELDQDYFTILDSYAYDLYIAEIREDLLSLCEERLYSCLEREYER